MRRQQVIGMALALTMLSACQTRDESGGRLTADSTRFSGKKFAEHIRSTEARDPEEERAGFELPPGFEIQLFASEPDIGKPINLTFDAQGRMWVTQSFEYPFPAEPGKGKDRISILEDTDHDGKADRFTHFSDTLNIPIGVFPLNDGAVAYSIPNVYRFVDQNNDGKADSKNVLLGPFEHRDTHGMVNNFMRGFDGWIHACHGFTNRSTVAGADGDSIRMISGNTFRFRPDGSRVEHYTHGRINPFGLAYDEMGYLYSTDCHTSPLYQLIRGADYTQWGKEEGMGFAPDMKPLEKEATALCGIAYYADVKFPEEYRSNFYIGDAVASRVYRNSFSFEGSTPVGKLEGEFILSDDPWFRPVDVKLGPDGALYVADFYNSIIGHYEVPLNHPKRDRVRGRIWRITFKGASTEPANLATATSDELISSLDEDNLTVRLAAADQLAERIGQPAAAKADNLISKKGISARAYVHALWVLSRLNALTRERIEAAAGHDDPLIRLHTMRILAEREHPDKTYYPLVVRGLKDKDPHVRRAATEVLVKFPDMEALRQALAVRADVPEGDTHQLYTTRLVLRTLLRHDALMKEVAASSWDGPQASHLVDVIVGVPSAHAAVFLAAHTANTNAQGEMFARLYEHLARFIPADRLEPAISAAKSAPHSTEKEFLVFKGIQQGLARRGAKESAAVQRWGTALSARLIEAYPPDTASASPETVAMQRFASELAGKYKVRTLTPALRKYAGTESLHDDVKLQALRALITIDVNRHAPLAAELLQGNGSPQFKIRVASLLGDFPGSATNKVLAGVTHAPPLLQSAVVMSLAGTAEGVDIIFRKVRNGELLPRTLIDPKVEERILMKASQRQRKEFEGLTASLEPVSAERQTLIDTRLIAFNTAGAEANLDSGKMVFRQNCSACHAVAGEGGAIGPQLDGVGKWGARALSEKILDPNRNVSESFRNYTITMKDGSVKGGLFRREEGAVVVFADLTGKEFSVPKDNIAEQKISRYTLMPDHFGEVLSQKEFNHLVKYLLSRQQ